MCFDELFSNIKIAHISSKKFVKLRWYNTTFPKSYLNWIKASQPYDNWKDFVQKVRQITMVQFFLKTVVIWRKIFKWDICSQFSSTVYIVQRGGNLQGPLFVTKKLCLIAKLFHESSVFLTIESFDKSTCSISLLKQRFQIVFLLLLRSCTHKKWKWKPFFSFRPKPAAAAGSSNLTYVAYDIITHHGW